MAVHVFKDWLERQGEGKSYGGRYDHNGLKKVPPKIARHFPCNCHASGWQGDFFIHYGKGHAWVHTTCGIGYKLPTVHRIIIRVEHYHKGRGYKKEGHWAREFEVSNHTIPPKWWLGVTAYAYQFQDQTLTTDNVLLNWKYSRRYLIDGVVYTLAEIMEKYPGNKWLIEWVGHEANLSKKVMWCRTRNWTLFTEDDVIV